MKTGFTRLLALASFAASLLASCGGGSATPNKLRIGLECAYVPFNWTVNEASEFTLPIANHAGSHADGYDIQIAKRISKQLNREVEIVRTPWESLITDLQMGAIDAIIAGMTDTEERRRQISFTEEYYRSELVLIVSKSAAEQVGEDPLDSTEFGAFVSGRNIVSQVSTVTNDVIDIFSTDYGANHVTPVATFALAAQDVVSGSAFAMTAELPVARSIVGQFPTLGIVHIDQEILGETRSELGVSIGVRKNDSSLLAGINATLSSISTEERVQLMEGAVARSAGVE